MLYDLADEPRSRLNVKFLGEGSLNTLMEQIGSLMTSFPSFLGDLLKPEAHHSPFKLMPTVAVLDVRCKPPAQVLSVSYISMALGFTFTLSRRAGRHHTT